MDNVEVSTERALAREALALVDDPRAVVVGGLGLGFTMHEVLADSRVELCAVVEIEQALVDWMRDGTIPHGPALLADERVNVVVADVAVALAEARPASYDLVLLDVDNGPGYLVHDANAALYEPPVLAVGARRAAPGRRPGRLVGRRGARARGGACATVFGDVEATPHEVRLQERDEQYWLYVARVAVDAVDADEHSASSTTPWARSRCPRRAVAGPDPARGRELPDQRHPDRAAADPRASALVKAAAAVGQRRARRPRRPSRPTAIAAAAAAVAAGEHDDAVPDRRLPDRVRHQLQHERQRGDRHAGDRGPASTSTPTTTSTPASRATTRSRPRSTSPRRSPWSRTCCPALDVLRDILGAKAEEFAGAGEVGPHAPDGRDAGDARPGVRRVRRHRALRRASGSSPCSPGSASCRSAAPRSAPASTPRPASPRGYRGARPTPPASRSPRPATTSRPRAPATRWSSCRGVLRTIAVGLTKICNDLRWMSSGPDHRARRDPPARPPARVEHHARQGEPGAARGDADGLLPGHRQRRRRHRRRRERQLRAQRRDAGAWPATSSSRSGCSPTPHGCSPRAASTASPPTPSGCAPTPSRRRRSSRR